MVDAVLTQLPQRSTEVWSDRHETVLDVRTRGREGSVRVTLREPLGTPGHLTVQFDLEHPPEVVRLGPDDAATADTLVATIRRAQERLARVVAPPRPAPTTAELPESERTQMNAALWAQGLDGRVPQPSIGRALQTIGDVLAAHGYEWETILNSHLFLTDSGHRGLDFARSTPGDSFSPKSVENSMISFSWYKFPTTGRYEVIARFT